MGLNKDFTLKAFFMQRSKKVFIIVAALFIVGVLVITVDIMTKTTLPGSKKYLKESIMPSEAKEEGDQVENEADTLQNVEKPVVNQ